MKEAAGSEGVRGHGKWDLAGMSTYQAYALVSAKEVTRQQYCAMRGWKLPADENGADAGFVIQGVDGDITWKLASIFHRDHTPEVT